MTSDVPGVGVGDPGWVPSWSVINIGDRLRGGGFDADPVAKGFEFADESAFAGFEVVDSVGEVV